MVGRDHVLLSRGGTLCHQLAQLSPPKSCWATPAQNGSEWPNPRCDSDFKSQSKLANGKNTQRGGVFTVSSSVPAFSDSGWVFRGLTRFCRSTLTGRLQLRF